MLQFVTIFTRVSIMKNINQFPRYQLVPAQTLIMKLNRLSAKLAGPTIYLKRDDTNFIGGGGNKLRKLEFYLGAAKEQGCDTILAMGAWQSNHARLSAAAALNAGFECEIILGKKVARDDNDYNVNGNLVLDRIMGIKIHETNADADLMAVAIARKAELEAQGKKVYIIPFGGSSALGSLGYVNCAMEIQEQAQNLGVNFDYIVTTNGSSGTHAGLLAGCKILQSTTKVIGYNVLKPTVDTLPVTLQVTQDTLDLLETNLTVTAEDVLLNDQYIGTGYGQPTEAMREAVKMVAHEEGIFLDPVYSGKAFSGLIGDIRAGKYTKGQNILFIMTGGAPGLYAYQAEF